jgi:molecular chaperone DnaJ
MKLDREAGLGAKIEVPTIDGRAQLKIPQGTHSGPKFRLREKGVLNSRTNQRGDQIVDVQVPRAGGAGRTH